MGRIPDTGYPALEISRILQMAQYPANYRISGRITGYPALEISQISDIRIVSISGWILKMAGYPAKPDIRPNPKALEWKGTSKVI